LIATGPSKDIYRGFSLVTVRYWPYSFTNEQNSNLSTNP
jgi:hypothetical protein